MSDQANELRQMMQSLPDRRNVRSAPLRTIVVWGAQPNVGTTSAAVNLSAELARHSRRVLLVDAGPMGGASRLCRLNEPSAAHRSGWAGASLADVYRGRRKLAEAIRRGAHGLRVAGDADARSTAFAPTQAEVDTLAEAIRALGSEADLVLIDAGSGPTPAAERLSQTADLVLKVTTTADAAIMDAYAAIKRLSARERAAKIAVLMSRCATVDEAEDAFGRLGHGCRRFLNVAIDWAGCIVEDATVADAQSCAAPFVALSPRCEAARGIQQTAEYVLGVLSHATSRASSVSASEQDAVVNHIAAETCAAVGEAA